MEFAFTHITDNGFPIEFFDEAGRARRRCWRYVSQTKFVQSRSSSLDAD